VSGLENVAVTAPCYGLLESGGQCTRAAVVLIDGVGGKVPACRRCANRRDRGQWRDFSCAPRRARFMYRIATGDGVTYNADPSAGTIGAAIVAIDLRSGAEVRPWDT